MISTAQEWKDFSRNSSAYSFMITIPLNVDESDDSDIIIDELELADGDFKAGTLQIIDEITTPGNFDLGGVISNTFEVELMSGIPATYDLINEGVTLEFGVPSNYGIPLNGFQRGVYTIDPVIKNGIITKIKGYDHMGDDYFNSANINDYDFTNKTVLEVVKELGFELETEQFVGYSRRFPTIKVTEEYGLKDATRRTILGYICQMNCVYARYNNNGKLEFKRFSKEGYGSTDLDGGVLTKQDSYWISSADNADGGHFEPWNTGDVVRAGTFEQMNQYQISKIIDVPEISSEEISVTGAYVEGKDGSFIKYGDDGYFLSVVDNPLIRDASAISQTAAFLNNYYIDPYTNNPFFATAFSINYMADPSLEAGDNVWFTDKEGHVYHSIVTSFHYNLGGVSTISCDINRDGHRTLEDVKSKSQSTQGQINDINSEVSDLQKQTIFQSGDKYPSTLDTYWLASGYITNSGMDIIFGVKTGKSMKNISSGNIKFVPSTNGGVIVRGIGGYLHNGNNYFNPNSFTFNVYKIGEYDLTVRIRNSSAWANGTNNTPVLLQIYGQFIF